VCKFRGQKEALLCGLTPPIFHEALETGSLGTLAIINHQLIITVVFKKKKVETPY
jgi:hypothetical protein